MSSSEKKNRKCPECGQPHEPFSWPTAIVAVAFAALIIYMAIADNRGDRSIECAKFNGKWSVWWGGYCYKD